VNTLGWQTQITTPAQTWIPGPSLNWLYASAWLDLSMDVFVFSTHRIPDGRWAYYEIKNNRLLPFRTVVARQPATYLIMSQRVADFLGDVMQPDWQKFIPSGWQVVVSPTELLWIVRRLEVKSQADIPNVVAIQNQHALSTIRNALDANNRAVRALNALPLKTRVPYTFNPDFADDPDLSFYDQVGQFLRNTPPREEEALYFNSTMTMLGFTNSGFDLNKATFSLPPDQLAADLQTAYYSAAEGL
jgi:hypothetical protein